MEYIAFGLYLSLLCCVFCREPHHAGEDAGICRALREEAEHSVQSQQDAVLCGILPVHQEAATLQPALHTGSPWCRETGEYILFLYRYHITVKIDNSFYHNAIMQNDCLMRVYTDCL